MKIAVIEDENELVEAIELLLEDEGYEVEGFKTIEAFLQKYENSAYFDLLIVDINLPDGNFLDLLDTYPDFFSQSRFLIISAYTEIENIKKSFSLGAVDFIKKPFDPQELLIRIQKFLQIPHKITFGNNLIFDRKNGIVYDKEKSILLSQQESKLLSLLLEHKGKYVTVEKIGISLWNDPHINPNRIAALVKRVRKKIGKENIQYKKGFGYIIF